MTIPSSTDEMLAGIPTTEPGNFGVIHISAVIMPYILQLDTYRVDKGHITFDVSFEDIRKKLLLPEEYTVEGVLIDAERALWYILVRSEAIPVVLEGALIPKVVPSYSKDMDTGVVTLTKLEIQQAP